MKQYIYPAGATVNGRLLTEPTTLPAHECIINGVRHGAVIFEVWTDDALAAIGITPTEVADPEPDPNDAIRIQIFQLESLQTPRRIREAALTEAGKAWLADVDAQISALRAQRV